ncbi:MAG: hypothetical protein Kow0031_35410 [Anaerolineae bacterium]
MGEKPQLLFLATLALLAAALLLPTGCAANSSGSGVGKVELSRLTLAPASELPDFVLDAPADVQEVYRFALANKAVLEQIPCYCGCNTLGHRNNYECYVNTTGEALAFEPHGAY